MSGTQTVDERTLAGTYKGGDEDGSRKAAGSWSLESNATSKVGGYCYGNTDRNTKQKKEVTSLSPPPLLQSLSTAATSNPDRESSITQSITQSIESV